MAKLAKELVRFPAGTEKHPLLYNFIVVHAISSSLILAKFFFKFLFNDADNIGTM
jgi:hypothetical protein